MLSAILTAVHEAGRPLCLAELSAALDIEPPALEGMLDTLVARRRLRAIRFEADGCDACPIKGGCFIMRDSVAVTYAVPLRDVVPEMLAGPR